MKIEIKKRIINSVSSNRQRFRAELENAFKKLNRIERQDLKDWVISEFGAKYPNIIELVFEKEANRMRLGL